LEEVVGKKTWDAGGGVKTGYETSKSSWSAAKKIWLNFVLHFIPVTWQIISQIICNESAVISAFFVVRGSGCRC